MIMVNYNLLFEVIVQVGLCPVAILTVIRDRGTFGQIVIPVAISPAGQTDLTLSSPVVTFSPGQISSVSEMC